MTSASSPTRPPFKILVIQLARLGDTLQSLMALRAAKQLYPQLEIHFLARESFAIAAQKIDWINQVHTFSSQTLLAPFLSGKESHENTLETLKQWVEALGKENWNMIVNWSYSEASSYLTALIPSKIKLGYSRRSDRSLSTSDGWSHYIQGIVQTRTHQNIHLTDILTTQLLTALQIHVGDPVPSGMSSVSDKEFFSISSEAKRPDFFGDFFTEKIIALQIGTGQSEKTWYSENWAELIQILLHRNPDYKIVLLGGSSDIERSQQILEFVRSTNKNNHRITSLVGKTSFDEWVAAIRNSQWLIAGNTAAIHLASVLGTRVLNLSIGPVKFLETGPYGNGHYVISPYRPCQACATPKAKSNDHTCNNDISPQAVYATWAYGANEWAHRRQMSLETHFSNLGWTKHLEKVQILRSKVRSPEAGGGVQYEPFLKKSLLLEDWTAMVMGQMARSWYCGWTPAAGQEITRESISVPLVQSLRTMKECSEVLLKIYDKAIRTSLSLNRKGTVLRSDKVMDVEDRKELQEIGQTLLDLDTLIDQIVKTHPSFLPFVHMARVLMHHLQSSQLAELGKETADAYRQLQDGIKIYLEWIEFTLDLVKPTVLSPKVTNLKDRAQTRSRPPELT